MMDKVLITASFTSEPLGSYVRFWFNKLNVNKEILFSPYNHVFQEIYNIDSQFHDANVINVLLFRFEDVIRDSVLSDDEKIDILTDSFNNLKRYFLNLKDISKTVVGVFPKPEHYFFSKRVKSHIESITKEWFSFISDTSKILVIDFSRALSFFHIQSVFDPISDKEAHIPFQEEFYAIMAAEITRKIRLYKKHEFKVIVLDCDNTLWKGICGEVGVQGVEIDANYDKFQRYILQKQNEGMLITLCSKNNLSDVQAVFEHHPGMVIKQENIVAQRVNWKSKSENIKDIAKELNLGLDSFIFFDDSHVECLQVMEECPQILTCHLPKDMSNIERFLYHIWAFDKLIITQEDRERSHMYISEKKRQNILGKSKTLGNFLENLELTMWVNPVDKNRLDRASQLTQRTNQFNLSTRRRSTEDFETLLKKKSYGIWSIDVADKFGCYGFSGLVIMEIQKDKYFLDTFLLSCRVLGRDIELAILDLLISNAKNNGKRIIEADFFVTDRNKSISDFFEKTGWEKVAGKDNVIKYQIKTDTYNQRNKYVRTFYNEGYKDSDHEPNRDSCSSHFLISGDVDVNLNCINNKNYAKFDLSIYSNSNMLHVKELLPLEYFEARKIVEEAALNEASDNTCRAEYLEPTNTTETQLIQIYSAILHQQKIGINDHFFKLGGNSLKATYLVSKIHKYFGVNLGLVDVFKNPEVKTLSQIILKAEKNNVDNIEPLPVKDYYDTSIAQQKMFFLSKLKGIKGSYHIPKVLLLEGPLDLQRLEDAFRNLLNCYEIFRTSFGIIDSKTVQIVNSSVSFKIENISSKNTTIDRIMADFERPFKLDEAPLMRVGLVNVGRNKHYLLFDIHHIISDGTTLNIIFRRLSEFYKCGKTYCPESLQYKDFAHWQNSLIRKGYFDTQKDFLIKKFSSDVPVINLPYDLKRPITQSFEGNQETVVINMDVTRRLKSLAQREDVTLFMVLISVYSILLARYSGQDDICIGIPVSGRFVSDIENVPGVFINTIVARFHPGGEKIFTEYLKEVKEEAIECFSNQNYPFEALVDTLNIKRDPSRNPLFDVMFNMQNMEHYDFELSNLKVEGINYHNKSAKVDITCEVWEKNNQLVINFEYCTAIFLPDTIARFAENYITLVEAISLNPGKTIASQKLISDIERKLIVSHFNETTVPYNKQSTIDRLFEKQVDETPDRIALQFKDVSLTYMDLNCKANCLASQLISQGLQVGDLVGILLNRGPELIVAMLAVLKAGGAYVPLDPTYPSERLEYMLSDCNASFLVSNKELVEDIEYRGKVIEPDIKSSGAEIYTNPHRKFTSHNLAYVIYTSGSTGNPKGVMIEHVNVHNFILGMIRKIDFSSDQSVLTLTTACFDIFVLETLLPLTQGLRIVIADEKEQQNAHSLSRCISKHCIDIVQMTPSHLQLLFEGEGSFACLQGVKSLLIGGEALSAQLFEKLKILKNTRIYNVYGPTETTVWSTVRDITEISKIDIGKPIANTSIYVMNRYNDLQPIGVVGEICIGGDGVARGYVNREELTNEKFVVSSVNPKERLYRTGDLGRWRADGNLECLGRLDHQVKIRGHRIELDEIKAKLCEFAEIKDGIVIVDESSKKGKRLVAYYVADKEIPVGEIRLYLKNILPDYMVPELYMKIDCIPLTLNGKVDRNALPSTSDMRPSLGNEFKESETDIEKELSNIWREVLGRDSIGIYDNFFDLGGNSMLIVAMCSQLEKKYNDLVDVTDVFANSTIYKLANFIENAIDNDSTNIVLNESVLPDELFLDSDCPSGESLLEFEIESLALDELRSLADSTKINFFDIALGCYIYVFSELSGRKSISIQVVSPTDVEEVINLNIDLCGISDLISLFVKVHEDINSTSRGNRYHIRDLEKISFAKSERGIYPLFGEKVEMISTLMGLYDIIVNIDLPVIRVRYNRGRLAESGIMTMTESYCGLFNAIAKNIRE